MISFVKGKMEISPDLPGNSGVYLIMGNSRDRGIPPPEFRPEV